MMTMNATPAPAPTSSGYCSDSTDSDDSDVAFANMDFGGVDFGGDEEDATVDADADAGPATNTKEAVVVDNNASSVSKHGDDCEVDANKEVKVDDDASPIGDVLSDMTLSVDCASSASPNKKTASETTTAIVSTSIGKEKGLSSIVFPQLEVKLSGIDKKILVLEKDQLLPRSDKDATTEVSCGVEVNDGVKNLFTLLKDGKYAEILRSEVALEVFGSELENLNSSTDDHQPTMMEQIKRKMLSYFSSEEGSSTTSSSEVNKCIELEIIGVASLNLFLQLNYTGPSMDRGLKPEEGGNETSSHPLDGINPHEMFKTLASKENELMSQNTSSAVTATTLVTPAAPLTSISEDVSTTTNKAETKSPEQQDVRSLKETNTTDAFHNVVLSELAVDGEWPFQVCVAPYFLLLARAILSTLAEPTRPFRNWLDSTMNSVDDATTAVGGESFGISTASGAKFAAAAKQISGASLWNARAIVAHRRLISTRRDDDDGQACPTLWNEAEAMFSQCLATFGDGAVIFDDKARSEHVSSGVMLEWGLAQHHFRKLGRGKKSFNKALEIANLDVEVTGAEGVRTKYQKKATAQYLVRAKPRQATTIDKKDADASSSKKKETIEKQMITHDEVSDDALLLEKVKFEEQDDNMHYNLPILEQSILLALCLDVKNDNPMDGLTGEQMGAYLARVLNQHDDWMVYATALLERAWLECERTHGRERAILQIQALADQHSNRLTLTQSTFKSVEEDSAPAQDRLRNLHVIVYPPRWDMLRDLAERYAKLGVVTSAAEIFEELELWDEVVECYRVAGKEGKAEEVVRKRLANKETPRMLAALGDLTRDPQYFHRSLELSNGKFYDSNVALGKYYFDKGDVQKAVKYFLEGLEVKPLMPNVWFRVGTISMQLKDWDTALRAFTEVVQQEPETGDAWANVAAIHMHRKNPAEAYPALVESLKQNRNNWRVWVSKLYTCIDLKKYDEAIQTCTELLNLRARQPSTSKVEIPTPEEKCIRAIVGGSLNSYHDARVSKDEVALDSAKRTLARVRQLLDKMKSSTKSEAWLYEISSYFNEEMGWKEDVFNDLMKEYRTLQSQSGWEEDLVKVSKMTSLVKGIFSHHKSDGSKESLVKCKLLVNGVAKKIRGACVDSEPPKELEDLDALLKELEEAMMLVAK